MCRKTHGTAFATYAGVDAEQLEWLAGQARIAQYESSPGFFRAFCEQCGATVPGIASDGHAFMPAGCFDVDPQVVAKVHIFVASKAPWYEIAGELRQFDAWPDPSAATLESSAVAPVAGTLEGSCLCGAIHYVVTGPVDGIWCCHCSRCQKANAAAHATNGFTDIENVRFTRGESNVGLYEIPDATHFTQAFCKTCGSLVPRLDQSRQLAIIPWGSLDTRTEQGPQRHIYVGSKAPWYSIDDDLPKHLGSTDPHQI